MSRIRSSKLRSVLATVFVLVLASLVLAACGGSSKSSSSTTSTSAKAASKTTTGGPAGAGSKRFTALRECLAKEGITLPKPTGAGRKPGKGGPGAAGGFLGGGGAGPRQLPKGVSKTKYEAAIKKCGGGFAGGGHFKRGGASSFASPAAKAALTKFATCMRENGVNVPAPNTSGKGPVFNTKGLNTSSSTFKAAETKCASILRAAYKPSEGAGGGGEPPSSAG
jgi:hypothetical protein